MLQEPPAGPTGGKRPSATTVRRLQPHDVAATADLHIACLGEGLFPQLGPRFMRRWHRTFVDNPYTSAHVAVDSAGEVVAFILAATDQGRYVARTISADKWPLAGLGVLALATRPALTLRFVRTRLRKYAGRLLRRRTRSSGPTPPPTGVVHAVVTAEAARGQGLGRLLLECVEADVLAQGVSRIELLTDDDGGAVSFYRRLGWEGGHVRVNRDGRRMAHFGKDVAVTDGQAGGQPSRDDTP